MEDEYRIREGIKHLVDWEANGLSIVGEAGNGKEAVEKIERLHPHIVITDILMPEMSGVELIKIIRSRYPTIQVLVLSGYSDYEYVRAAFQYGAKDYILKPMLNSKDLLNMLQKLIAKVPGLVLHQGGPPTRERLLESLLSGFLKQNDIEDFNKQFKGPAYLLMGINVSYVFEKRQDMQYHVELLQETAKRYFPDINFTCTVLQDEIVLLMLNLDPCKYEEALINLKNTAKQYAEYCGDAFFVCSVLIHKAEDIKRVYQGQLIDLMQERFYQKGVYFLLQSDMKYSSNVLAFDKEEFSELLRQDRLKEAIELLKEAIIKVIQYRSMSELELKSLVQSALYEIMERCEKAGTDEDKTACIKRDFIVRISNVRFADSLLAVVNEIAQEIEKFYVPQTPPMDKILKYINNHYSEHLTLADLAERFNFNYYYLSAYFNTKYAENFSEYLNNIRIAKAKQLLQDRNIPVAEVGNMVGYTDNSYFARVFKKHTGMTPSKCREKNISDCRAEKWENIL